MAHRLGVNVTWNQIRDGQYLLNEKDPLYEVHYGIAFLTHFAGLSIRNNMPLIFDG
ncbi:MAG: hypothetical protein ACKVP0_06355 [Pirellulaceae bacterium]